MVEEEREGRVEGRGGSRGKRNEGVGGCFVGVCWVGLGVVKHRLKMNA